MFRFDRKDKAQRQTEERTHQDPVIRRQTECNGVRRDPEDDNGFGQERTPCVGIQTFDELRAADKAFVLDTGVEPLVGEHHGVAEDDVQPEGCAEGKDQRVPAVVHLEGPDRRAGERRDPLSEQREDKGEEHAVKPPDNKLQEQIVRLVATGPPAGLDHLTERGEDGDFQEAGNVRKFVDQRTEVLETGQIPGTGSGDVDPAPAAGTEGEEKDQCCKKNKKQDGKNIGNFHRRTFLSFVVCGTFHVILIK